MRIMQHKQYYNPDPLLRLTGEANDATIYADGVECQGLINLGAQLSTIKCSFAEFLGLSAKKLNQFIRIDGTGGNTIPYLGYVEAKLEVANVQNYRQNVLFLVLEGHPYDEWVPVQMGTVHTDAVLNATTDEEIKTLSQQWQHGQVAVLLANGNQPDTLVSKAFMLNKVRGSVN